MTTPTIVTETLTHVLPRAIREMETILAQHYTMMGDKTIDQLVDGVTQDHTKWIQNYFVRGVEIVAERDGLDLYLDNASGWDMMVNGYPVELKVTAEGINYATGNKHGGDKTNLNWTVQIGWDKTNDSVVALSSSIVSLDDCSTDSGYIKSEGKGAYSTLKVTSSDVDAITILTGGVKTNRKWSKPITTPWTGEVDNIGVIETTTKVSKIAKVAPVVFITCDTHFVEILPTGVCPSCE